MPFSKNKTQATTVWDTRSVLAGRIVQKVQGRARHYSRVQKYGKTGTDLVELLEEDGRAFVSLVQRLVLRVHLQYDRNHSSSPRAKIVAWR